MKIEKDELVAILISAVTPIAMFGGILTAQAIFDGIKVNYFELVLGLILAGVATYMDYSGVKNWFHAQNEAEKIKKEREARKRKPKKETLIKEFIPNTIGVEH